MTANRVAAIAAVCAAVSWAVKAIAIWIAGGLDKTPLEDILFWLGFGAMVVASSRSVWPLHAGARSR